ncbi:MAG: PQQ-like beta-propeller repeat protein [Asgard group archaeon]|nr:PQQ-like beta-propeller repeat protein [Asgard group archaeon]
MTIESKQIEIVPHLEVKAEVYTIAWTFNTINFITVSPAFMDRNKDGYLELIVGDWVGNVYCLDSMGEELWCYTSDDRIIYSPAIMDLNDDKHPEIIVANEAGQLLCLDENGSLLWIFTAPNIIYSSPMLVDLNNDSSCEILFSCTNNYLYCLDKDGYEDWNYTNAIYYGIEPSIGDTDLDGDLEIILIASTSIIQLNYLGQEESIVDLLTIANFLHEPLVTDINNNSILDLLFFNIYHSLVYVNTTNYYQYQFSPILDTLVTEIRPSPPIATDLNHDGEQDIIFSIWYNSTHRNLYSFGTSGCENFKILRHGSFDKSCVVADFDKNDGKTEILFSGSELLCVDTVGNELWSYMKEIGDSPLIVDIDNDDALEIIAPLVDESIKLVCLEITYAIQSGGSQWYRHRGNEFNTGYIDNDCDYLDDLTENIINLNSHYHDSDLDLLTDGEEFLIYYTNPKNADTDQDLLNDGNEIECGTNPLIQDTDQDGILDGDEVNTYGTDPLKADSDEDGLDDLEEITLGVDGHITDPTDADSDNDDLNDYEEFNYETDPNDNDSDNDDLTDGQEVSIYSTDPNNADTDNDGYSDGIEITEGTDPLDPEDYPGATTPPTYSNTTTNVSFLFGNFCYVIIFPVTSLIFLLICERKRKKNQIQ